MENGPNKKNGRHATLIQPRFLRACLLVFCALPSFFTASAAAGQTAVDVSRLVAERPDPPGTPTQVELSAYVIDVDEIQDARQRFGLDLFYLVRWKDPRLALSEEERSGQVRRMSPDEVWMPRALIVNEREVKQRLPQDVEVEDDGQVTFRMRIVGQLSADFDFREFPLDTQVLPIDVLSYRYTTDELRLAESSPFTGNFDGFAAEGWSFQPLTTEITEFINPTSGQASPRITFRIEASRDSTYHLVTMFLPMSLVVMMSWAVFFLQPNLVPPRISLATSAIFSLIAFGFTIRLSLPSVPYVTRADVFVIGCTLLVFIALAVAVIGSRMAGQDKMGPAIRLNALARWLYIAFFMLVAVAAFSL